MGSGCLRVCSAIHGAALLPGYDRPAREEEGRRNTTKVCNALTEISQSKVRILHKIKIIEITRFRHQTEPRVSVSRFASGLNLVTKCKEVYRMVAVVPMEEN